MASDLDHVRLQIGDTDVSNDPLLSDAEITVYLDDRSVVDSTGATTSVNIVAAAADAAGAIAAKYARQFDFSEDSQTFSRAQRVGHYTMLEQQLRKRQGGYSAPVRLAGTATTS